MRIDVPGWMSEKELDLLELLVKRCDGPILEIGSWLGLSTICISNAIISSNLKRFITVDVFPTFDNFIESGPRVLFRIGNEPGMTECSKEEYDLNIEPYLILGVKNEFIKNLQKFSVSHIVEVVQSDIVEFTLSGVKFDLIFADCCHNTLEMNRNLPKILSMGSDKCFYAIHDTTFELSTHASSFGLNIIDQCDSLAVYTL